MRDNNNNNRRQWRIHVHRRTRQETRGGRTSLLKRSGVVGFSLERSRFIQMQRCDRGTGITACTVPVDMDLNHIRFAGRHRSRPHCPAECEFNIIPSSSKSCDAEWRLVTGTFAFHNEKYISETFSTFLVVVALVHPLWLFQWRILACWVWSHRFNSRFHGCVRIFRIMFSFFSHRPMKAS